MTNSTPRFFDPAPLLPYLADGWRILTPNSRLASRVRLSVVAQEYAQSPTPVAAPNIQSLKNWFDALWQQLLLKADALALSRRILDDDQELLLWQQIVAASGDAANLLNPRATAQDLMRARRWLWQWQIDPEAPQWRPFFISREHQAALAWFKRFDQSCEKQQCLTREARNSYIARLLINGEWPFYKSVADESASDKSIVDKTPAGEKILLLGFAELAPRDRALLAALPQCVDWPINDAATRRELLAFNSHQDELLAAAHWIKQCLQQTDQRIALVVPNLTARRSEIVRVMQQVLQPEQLQVDSGWQIPPFNISAGESLGDLPIARIAIFALRLAYTHLQRAEWQALFNSAYFSINNVASANSSANSSDVVFVARLLERLAETRSDSLNASALRQAIQRLAKQYSAAQTLAECLLALATQQRQSAAKQSSSYWAEQFRQLLQDLGWPGQRGLHSIDFQQHKQVQDALDSFARADFLLTKLTAAEAIQAFEQLLQGQVFQPQSADVRLQILGTLEAAGLQFDAIWLLGMDEMQWPPAPAPNAFLPLSLQQDNHMPRASAQRELALAKTLTQQLLSSSAYVVASYCQLQDESHYQPSQLLEDFVHITAADFFAATNSVVCVESPLRMIQKTLAALSVQQVDAEIAPAYQRDEILRGGSRIINDQAQCPFRSFVAHRLQGEALESVGYAFDQREQGSLLHKSLEEFWFAIAGQEQLNALSDQQLQQQCDDAIAKALHSMTQDMLRRGVVFGPVLQQLEAQRLRQRLLEWLDVEKQRPSFTVQSREQSVQLALADLTLNLRSDRIDKLADDSLLVIDYKTGLADKPSQWLGERPENLQLPLYAVQLQRTQQAVAGLAFAKIHAEKTLFEGLGRDEQTGLQSRYQLGGNKDNPPDWFVAEWPDLLQHWETTVEKLAAEFCRGEAGVAPLKPPATCNHCELKPVCRFYLDDLPVDNRDDDDALSLTEMEWREDV